MLKNFIRKLCNTIFSLKFVAIFAKMLVLDNFIIFFQCFNVQDCLNIWYIYNKNSITYSYERINGENRQCERSPYSVD